MPEIVLEDVSDDIERRSVDLDAGDLGGVEAKSGQDVEPAAHADDRDSGPRHQGRVVGGRVDRLLDADEGLGCPVVVDPGGERIVVLGENLPDASEERRVLTKERGVDAGVGSAARNRGDLDARHRIPFGVLEHGLRTRIARGREHGTVRVVDGEDLVALDQADRKGHAGEDAEQPQSGGRGAQEDRGAQHHEEGKAHNHGLDAEVVEEGEDNERAQGRSHQVEEVDPSRGQPLVRKKRSQHDAREGEGQGEEQRVGRPLDERLHEGHPGEHRAGLRPRCGEEAGRGHGRQPEQARAHHQGLGHAPERELREGGEKNARDREPEHGQGNDQEGVVVEELRGDDPVDQNLEREGRARGQEGQGARLIGGQTTGRRARGVGDRLFHWPCRVGVTGALPPARGYKTVSRRTSSMVVIPCLIFSRPLMRRVSMPSSMAFLRSSTEFAPIMMSSRTASLISSTS